MTGGLHDLSELHIRRARGLACPADKALVQVILHLVGKRKSSLRDRADEVETPTRRVWLKPVCPVGRTLV